jgi:hypothetical protein
MTDDAAKEIARKLFGPPAGPADPERVSARGQREPEGTTTLNEKQSRDAALLGPMHGIYIGPEPEQTATPNFDGGVRTDLNEPRADPSQRPHVYREPGGWLSIEIEDGAELLHPFLRGK